MLLSIKLGPPTLTSFMDEQKLTPGAYRLMTELHNPKGDHRTRHNWTTAKSFKAESLYYVDLYFGSNDGTLSIRHEGAPMHQVVIEGDARFQCLSARLERCEETPSDWLRRQDKGGLALAILDKLVADGRITCSDVESAATEDLEYLPNL